MYVKRVETSRGSYYVYLPEGDNKEDKKMRTSNEKIYDKLIKNLMKHHIPYKEVMEYYE